jgi:hypothetical protein
MIKFFGSICLALSMIFVVQTSQAAQQSTAQTSSSWNISFEHIEMSSMAGLAFVNSEPLGTFSFKPAFKVSDISLFLEPSIEVAFNSDRAMFPIKAGARWNFDIADANLTPFAHFSMGPAFATEGSTVIFSMFAGPGAMYKLAQSTDLRIDLGFVMYEDQPGFQLQAGVTL